MGGISWFDGVKWCNAASEIEGRTPCYYDADGNVYRQGMQEEPRIKWKVNGYRLPTRAEWDHAAAGGTHFDFWWPEGYRKIRDYAYVHFDNVASGLSAFATHPVGKKKPNPFGLYDITQVGERCWDWNGPYSGDETHHPKGCSRTDAMNYLKSFLQGFHQPERETPESEGPWGVGTCQGDSDWSVIRRRYGNPTDCGHAHGLRVVVSSERGDEDQTFRVVFDRLRGLPRPVALKKINDRPELVDVPAGSFDMGSGLPGMGRMHQKKLPAYDERPEHKVYVSAFTMARYETTLAQWRRVYDWAIKNGYEFDNKGGAGHSSSDDPRHPVVDVNWHDVLKWCNAASEMDELSACYYMDQTLKVIYRKGRLEEPVVAWEASGYRLPTEAEWEYAAFGGVNDCAYYWGNFITRIRDYAWVGGWFGDSGREHPDAMRDFLKNAGPNWKAKMWKQYKRKMWDKEHIPYPDHASHPVGQKIGNRYGLYDVFGNAAEMCWDRVAPYSLTIDDRIDPKGPRSKAEVAAFLSRPYQLPGHGGDRALRISTRPTDPGLRIVKGCCFMTGHGSGISGRHGPFLSIRSGVKPEHAHEEVGFRVAGSGGKTK